MFNLITRLPIYNLACIITVWLENFTRNLTWLFGRLVPIIVMMSLQSMVGVVWLQMLIPHCAYELVLLCKYFEEHVTFLSMLNNICSESTWWVGKSGCKDLPLLGGWGIKSGCKDLPLLGGLGRVVVRVYHYLEGGEEWL